MAIKKQPAYIFISLEERDDEPDEAADPYAVMWAKVCLIAHELNISEHEAEQIVLGRFRAVAEN
jgi:hypothetical protein